MTILLILLITFLSPWDAYGLTFGYDDETEWLPDPVEEEKVEKQNGSSKKGSF